MPGGATPSSSGSDTSNCYATGSNQAQKSQNQNSSNIISNYQQYIGKAVGTGPNAGSCANLVQTADPSIGRTSTWKKGEQVYGASDLQSGTPIATFNYNSNYGPASDPGGVSGGSHTAIYLSQNGDGIQVLDQWVGHPAAVRTIPWNNGSAETGTNFYVISH